MKKLLVSVFSLVVSLGFVGCDNNEKALKEKTEQISKLQVDLTQLRAELAKAQTEGEATRIQLAKMKEAADAAKQTGEVQGPPSPDHGDVAKQLAKLQKENQKLKADNAKSLAAVKAADGVMTGLRAGHQHDIEQMSSLNAELGKKEDELKKCQSKPGKTSGKTTPTVTTTATDCTKKINKIQAQIDKVLAAQTVERNAITNTALSQANRDEAKSQLSKLQDNEAGLLKKLAAEKAKCDKLAK